MVDVLAIRGGISIFIGLIGRVHLAVPGAFICLGFAVCGGGRPQAASVCAVYGPSFVDPLCGAGWGRLILHIAID